MKKHRAISFSLVFIAIFSLAGCAFQSAKSQGYPEIPSMLNVLTNKAQIAVEEGRYENGGEAAVLEYVSNTNPSIVTWFTERDFGLRVGVVADTAVVMVCDQGKPVFEDTYCRPGAPDKDHRNSLLQLCEITMSAVEVMETCKED